MLHAVRNALDEFVEEQYSQCLDINTPADPQSFIDVIKKEQTGVPSIGERDSVIMCAECTERSAHVECVQCQDVFCAACHGTTHMTGKRQYHEKVSVHQTVCHLCDRSLGTSQVLFGTGDARIFCDGCYGDEMLLNIAIRTLPKKYLSGLRCFECHTADATTICEDCSDLFCHRCFHKIHRRGRMARHVQLWIDEKGSIWRGGVCLRPEDVQAVIDKARKNSSRASWMLFQDDRLCSLFHLVFACSCL